MKPFEVPANANSAALFWFELPLTLYAASLDIAARQWAVWVAGNRAAVTLATQVWSLPSPSRQDDSETVAPAVSLATADMRETGDAVWRAQMDAVAALGRSA